LVTTAKLSLAARSLFEGGEGKLLVATVLDAADVEVHHKGFRVDADDHYGVVFLGVVARFVPDGFVR